MKKLILIMVFILFLIFLCIEVCIYIDKEPSTNLPTRVTNPSWSSGN